MKDLEKKLKTAKKYMDRRPLVPIMNCIKISDGTLTVKGSCTYYETTHESLKGIRCVVEFSRFSNIINKLKNESVQFGNTADGLNIISKKGTFKLNNFSEDEFPVIASIGKKLGVLSKEDVRVINFSKYARVKDELRPILGCTAITTDGYIVSTDTHKLRFSKCNISLDEEVHINIDLIDECELWSEANWLFFVGKNETIGQRKVVGTFPNFKLIIPRNNNKMFKIKANTLLSALDSALLACDPVSELAIFDFNNNKLSVSSYDLESRSAYNQDLEGECSFNLKIGMKIPFLIDIIKKENFENLELRFMDSLSPMIINDSALLMPIKM